jgi:homopolymeric O-antigen transport system permease protein
MASALVNDFKEMVSEQVEYRDLLYQMTKRDLLLRYKQTAMGFGWAVFTPLVNTAVFSVIFTRVAPIDTVVPYPVFAYCGLLVWNYFSSALKFSVNSLTSNTSLVTKVYFPREIFPVSAVAVSFVDFVVGATLLVALMVYYRIPVGPPIVLLPLVILVHVVFTTAVALVLARWNLFYRDVKYLFEVVIVVWMFATSVVYPVGLVGGRLGVIMQLNPMTPIVEAYRSVLLLGTWPPAGPLAAVGLLSVAFLAWSWVAFHRSEFEFAENI